MGGLHSANGTIRGHSSGCGSSTFRFHCRSSNCGSGKGGVERCYNITIRQFTCCVNAHLLLLECVENSNLQCQDVLFSSRSICRNVFCKKAATLLPCSRRNFVHAFHDPYCLINHHNHVKIIDAHISNTNPKRQF